MLRSTLSVAAFAAVIAIILSSGYVLTRDQNEKQTATVVASGWTGTPDASARGVIVLASSAGQSLYHPDGTLIRTTPAIDTSGLSVDGNWYAGVLCNVETDTCPLLVIDQRGTVETKQVTESLESSLWSDSGVTLAILSKERVLSTYDPTTAMSRVVAEGVDAYTWFQGELVFATHNATTAFISHTSGEATVMTATFSGVVSQIFEPVAGQPAVLLTVDAATGWQLLTYHADGRATSVDFPDSTDASSPTAPGLAMSWSPDGSRLAVAPISAPYNLFIFSRAGNLLNRVEFTEGYGGELKWSPDGQSLAVSTYSPDRTRHEVYLLAPGGMGQSRHLISGCIIQWSPDSRFLVAKSEPHSTGIAIANVQNGSSWHILGYGGYVPLSWGADEASALKLAQRPVRSAGTLAK